MHPVLGYRWRSLGYLLLWVAFGALIAAVIALTGQASVQWAALFAVPLGVLLGLQCLPCWYVVRGTVPGDVPTWRLTGTWLGSGFFLLSVWIGFANAWAHGLNAFGSGAAVNPGRLMPLVAFAGGVGILTTVLVFYMVAAGERLRVAERRALELRALAREAEMSFLRRQLDPHFLFNALNSVAALIGTDDGAARRMCLLLADFFRKSLRFSAQQLIALRDELTLIETFLAIEEVRFGDRLRRRMDVSDDALNMSVPALLLQPLVENAVHHGIAHLVAGGEIRVSARVQGTLLQIVVENTCDPDRPLSRSTGLGLNNVRGRIESLYGYGASMDTESLPAQFRVRLALPAEPPEGGVCAS